MSVDEILDYFGNMSELCRRLDMSPQNSTKWKARGYIPLLQQYRIAELTNGELMPDEVDPKFINRKGKQ